MKSIFRLVRGELYKFWKSKVLIIMTAVLMASIIIMTAIYSNYDKQVSGMLSMFYGGENRVTSFEMLDGNASDFLSMAGLEPESQKKFEEAFNKIKQNDDVKTMLVLTSPAVLEEMVAMTTPTVEGNPLTMPVISYLAGHTTQENVTQIVSQWAMYGQFAPLQKMVSQNFLSEYVQADETTERRMTELTDFLKNNGNYERSVLDFIKQKIRGFYADYQTLKTTYAAYDNSVSAFEELLTIFGKVTEDYNDISYFTSANMFSSNFLLVPTNGFTSAGYTEFINTFAPFESATYKDAVNAYQKIYQDCVDQYTVDTFKEQFLALIDSAYSPVSVDLPMVDHNSSEAVALRAGIASLISSVTTGANTVFYYESDAVRKVLEKVENNSTLTATEQELYQRFVTAQGTVDPLNPTFKFLDSTYTAKMSSASYEKEIKPYYDEKEKGLVTAARAKIEEVRGRYTDAQLIYGLYDSIFTDTITDQEYAQLYTDYKQAYGEYASRVGTTKNLIVSVNLNESIEANNLSDEQAKKILGFMLNSRYSLSSEMVKAQYLIVSDQLADQFCAPESLGGGYGAMQFIFMLTSVMILVFGIVLGAGAIAGEHSGGTMKLLLIRPHKRWQVLIAKFIAIAIVMLGMYLLNYLMTLTMGAIFWGLDSMMALSIVNATTAHVMHPAYFLFLQHAFGFIETMIFAQIATTLSTLFKSKSGAVAVSMLVYFLSFVLASLLSVYSWYKFIIFNNTNLIQYFTSTGPSLSDMNLGFSLGIDIVYIVVLAVIGLWTFAKRDAS